MKSERHFAGEQASVHDARGFVKGALAGLPVALINDVVLMISELATNSVGHAQSDYTIAVEVNGSTLRIEITDDGASLPRRRRPHVDEPYGRGLQIVETLSDRWGVDLLPDGGKTVWFVVAIPPRIGDSATQAIDGAAAVAADANVEFDQLIPRWLFVVKEPPARFAVAVFVPFTVGVLLNSVDRPQEARFGPLLALVLIAVAGTSGWITTALAGAAVATEYWWFCVPPIRSFAVADGGYVGAVVGMAALALALTALTRRIERTVAAVRRLDDERRQQNLVQGDQRRRAERTASQAEAVLDLGNVLSSAHSVRDVAETALDEMDIPAPFTAGSIAIVHHRHLHVIASRGSTPEFIESLEKVDLSRSPWLGDVLAGNPAYVEDRDAFAAKYPTALVLRLYPSGSWLVLPFRAENTVGLLSLHYIDPQPLKDYRLYFSLVSELLGTSLERARSEEQQKEQHRQLEQSFEERDRIARTLSTSLLPPSLPRLTGFVSEGWLRPASPDLVAGDFYDLFAVGEGGWVAVLGDVCGKGAEAAAVTTLTRYAARAAALDDPDPANVARVANQALTNDTSDLFCTMAIVRYEPKTESIDITLAGHPNVRLITNGEVRRLGTYAAAIGLAVDPPKVETVPMGVGDIVVLFSDGLVERDPLFREIELDMFLVRAARDGAASLSNKIADLLSELRTIHADDVAVLIVERTA